MQHVECGKFSTNTMGPTKYFLDQTSACITSASVTFPVPSRFLHSWPTRANIGLVAVVPAQAPNPAARPFEGIPYFVTLTVVKIQKSKPHLLANIHPKNCESIRHLEHSNFITNSLGPSQYFSDITSACITSASVTFPAPCRLLHSWPTRANRGLEAVVPAQVPKRPYC